MTYPFLGGGNGRDGKGRRRRDRAYDVLERGVDASTAPTPAPSLSLPPCANAPADADAATAADHAPRERGARVRAGAPGGRARVRNPERDDGEVELRARRAALVNGHARLSRGLGRGATAAPRL